jgi:hypothetical protein
MQQMLWEWFKLTLSGDEAIVNFYAVTVDTVPDMADTENQA